MKVLAALVALVVVIAVLVGGGDHDKADGGSNAPAAQESTVHALDHDTRAYLNQISTCQVAVGLVILRARRAATDLQLADEATQSRDVCDEIRLSLVDLDTDGFEDAATTGFYAVDRYKSGLNAILTYIDNPVPSKLIEARGKLREGGQSAAEARREINRTRRVHGLRPYRP